MTLVVDLDTTADIATPWLDPERIAAFRLDARTSRCAWTPAQARLYGYRPGSVEPSVELVYAHEHASDRNPLRRLMRSALDDAAGFVFVHRIMTTTGATLPVVTAVDVIAAPDGRGAALTAVTRPFDEASAARSGLAAPSTADDVIVGLREEIVQIREALEHRDEIGMAKGVIMAIEKTTSEQAFKRLIRASQQTNTRLRDVARAVVETGIVPG